MKKPTRADFGWTRQHGWKSKEDIDKWSDALCTFENSPKTPGGRPATNPIHESWNKISKLFDSSSFYRSRRAFCRWAGINYSTFSTMQRKPLKDDVERWILEWEATWNKEVKNG